MSLTILKWTLIAIYGLTIVSNLVDTAKHGQPRKPHDATTSALAAIIGLILAGWIWLVLP
jgi:hypothetical protein